MNTFGRIFKISIFGESHNSAVGIVVDGCPAGIKLNQKDFVKDIACRKSGAVGTTKRTESDKPIILSGVFNNFTTGSPITIIFENNDIKPSDYSNIIEHFRPGHADYTAKMKYSGYNDYRGGGHFSGRLTLPLVAAGVIAKKILDGINISAKIIEAGGSKNIEKAVKTAVTNKSTIGCIVECEATGIPVGWGEPFFDSVESVISHLAFAVPAIKGIEFGNGFYAAKLTGKEQNDLIINASGLTKTNNCGGINGGITNGNNLSFKVAVKPASSINDLQNTFNFKKNKITQLKINGRHDACIALRIPVVIEAITALALADFKLIFNSYSTYRV